MERDEKNEKKSATGANVSKRNVNKSFSESYLTSVESYLMSTRKNKRNVYKSFSESYMTSIESYLMSIRENMKSFNLNQESDSECNQLIQLNSNPTSFNLNDDETEHNFQTLDVAKEKTIFSNRMTENKVENRTSKAEIESSDMFMKLPKWKGIYQVEKIMGHGETNGIREYFVKWKGYDMNSGTWETKQTLKPFQELINQYEQEQQQASREKSTYKNLSPVHLRPRDIEVCGKHQCPLCGQHFQANELLKEHLNCHPGGHPHFTYNLDTRIYHCNYCKFSIVAKEKMIKHAQNFHVSIVNFEIKTRALIRNKSIRKDSPDIICPENLCVAIKKLDRATLLKFGQENFVKVFEDEIEYDHLSMFNRQKGSATFSKDSQSLTFSKSSMSLCSIPSKNKISNVANTTPQTPTDGLELLVINGAKSKPKTQTDDLDLLVSSRRERKRMKIAQKLAFNWFNVIEKSYNSHKNNFEQNNRSKEITTLLHKLEILLPEYKDGDRFLKETILKRASAYCKSLTQCHVLLRREEQELKLEMKKNRIKLVLMKNMQY